MPSLINRVPPGLLSLLGIKALGQNPSVLGDLLQAHLDVTSLYLNAFADVTAATTTAFSSPGIQGPSGFTVPPGEMWVVTRACAYTSSALAAATAARVRMAVYDTVQQRLQLVGEAASGIAGERMSCALDGPIVLTSGEAVQVYCEAFTAGTGFAMTVAAKIAKLTV